MRILVLAALSFAVVAAVSPAGQAADECRGLQVCIPVAGPWVVIPAANRASTAVWELKCPVGVVAGLDARVSDRRVAVKFPGRLGSPVNPGITTTDRVVFTATYVGENKATTFRPFIGCIRGAGGQRTPVGTTATKELKPGEPITTRVKTVRVEAGKLARVTQSCLRGERLLSAVHAVGLYSSVMPAQADLFAVNVVQTIVDQQILVSATRRGLPPQLRVEVQVHAECAR